MMPSLSRVEIMPSSLNALLMGLAGLMVLVGCSLLWHLAGNVTDDAILGSVVGYGERGWQYFICFFLFSWLSSLAALVVQRPALYAMSSGFLTMGLINVCSFDTLDLARNLLNLEDHSDIPGMLWLGQEHLRYLMAGGILALSGASLGFAVAALTHYQTWTAPRYHFSA